MAKTEYIVKKEVGNINGIPVEKYYVYSHPEGRPELAVKGERVDKQTYDDYIASVQQAQASSKPGTTTSTKTSGTATATGTGTAPTTTTATPRVKQQQSYIPSAWNEIRNGWNWEGSLRNMETDIGGNLTLKDALRDEVLSLLKNSKNSFAQEAYEELNSKGDTSAEDLLDNFTEFQRHVYTISGSISDFSKFDPEGKWDKDRNQYMSTASGLGLTPLNPVQTAMAQAYWKAMAKLKNDSRYSDDLKNYTTEAHGVRDEPEGKISEIDGWFGNTTVGQGVLSMIADPKVEKKKDEEVGSIKPNYSLEDGYAVRKKSPFWQQDMIALGRDFGNLMSINKYLPWMNKPEFFEADPTFYDPNRALAANAEQAAIASDAIAMYSGPQQTSARIAGTQREASKNAANIISEYDKRNVDVANRFEMFNAQGRNQAARVNSNIDNELYKGWVIANQQYDNSKRAMKNNLINTYINAVTNRAYTSNLNELFPQYSIDPASGGFLNFTPDRSKIKPSQGKNPIEDVIALKQTYPDMDINKLAELYLMAQKDLTESNEDPGVKAMKAMFGTRG